MADLLPDYTFERRANSLGDNRITSFPQSHDQRDEALATHELLSSPLIYLAAPYTHPDPGISRRRLQRVNRYAAYLLSLQKLVFSPLSHGAQLGSADIPDSVWYALGLRIMEGCDELHLLALDGWEDSDGVRMELERAWELDIPVYVVNPDTHEVLPREMTNV